MFHEIDNLLEMSLRLNRSPPISKQYEKYQVLREDQGQGTIYN